MELSFKQLVKLRTYTDVINKCGTYDNYLEAVEQCNDTPLLVTMIYNLGYTVTNSGHLMLRGQYVNHFGLLQAEKPDNCEYFSVQSWYENGNDNINGNVTSLTIYRHLRGIKEREELKEKEY